MGGWDCDCSGVSLVRLGEGNEILVDILIRRRFATEASLAEIHRVLKPGGTVGMIWNVEDCKFILSLTSIA